MNRTPVSEVGGESVTTLPHHSATVAPRYKYRKEHYHFTIQIWWTETQADLTLWENATLIQCIAFWLCLWTNRQMDVIT